jgi:RHS repeat-associated protein
MPRERTRAGIWEGQGTRRDRAQRAQAQPSTRARPEHAGVGPHEEYHPYGSTAFSAASGAVQVSAKRYRYTGKEREEATGLYYHGASYYAAWLGRWTAADPLGIAQPEWLLVLRAVDLARELAAGGQSGLCLRWRKQHHNRGKIVGSGGAR